MSLTQLVRLQLFAWCLMCTAAISSFGAAAPVDIQEIVRDLQKLRTQDKGFRLVWWIPPEYWQAVLTGNPNVSADDIESFVKAARKYTILLVVEARIGMLGTSTFTPEDEIRANTVVVDRAGTRYKPLPDQKIDGQVKTVLSVMRPVLSQMIGAMGENMNFLVFPGLDKAGKPLAEATRKGSLVVRLRDEEYRWKLPIGSFMAKKTCGKCEEPCSGAWSYCPWCGAELPESRPAQSQPAGEGKESGTSPTGQRDRL